MEEVIEPSTTEETQEATGLLDGGMPESKEEDAVVEEMDHRDPAEVEAENQDGKKAEKPEFISSNFWDEEKGEVDIEALAKSQADLRKQISQGKHKAPKDGIYDTASFGETPDDDPVKSHVLSWAKDNGVSQAALDDLVGQVVGIGGDQIEAERLDLEAERKALGPNVDARINSIKQWGRGLVDKGVWGKDDYQELTVWGGTAKGVAALEKYISAHEGRIPTDTTPIEGEPSEAEVLQMVGDPRYNTDPSYREKVERAFAQKFK